MPHKLCLLTVFSLVHDWQLGEKGNKQVRRKTRPFHSLSFFLYQETVFILSLSKRVVERKHSKKGEEFFVVSSNKVTYVAQDKAGK